MKVQSEDMEDGSVLHTVGPSSMRFYDFPGGVALHVCSGNMYTEFAPLIVRHGERIMAAHGKAIFMIDAYDSKSMTTEFRDSMTNWLATYPDKTWGHMLVRSKLLEMGINVANMLLGRATMRAYASITEWERAGTGFVPAFKRRPIGR